MTLWPFNFLDRLRQTGRVLARLLGGTDFMSMSDILKLEFILSNPAVLKVFALQCDLFSLGHIGCQDKDGKEIENDPLLDVLTKPSLFQVRQQLLWDHMFWTMMGTSYIYIKSSVLNGPIKNQIYSLNPFNIQWPLEVQKLRDKLFLTVDQFVDTTFKYVYNSGGSEVLDFNRLLILPDLTNGLGNWFSSPSRLDALYKVISNSEESLNAKNVNLRFSGKFLVGSPQDAVRTGLTTDEKESMLDELGEGKRRKGHKGKNVFPFSSMVTLRRFVDSMASLQLDEAYLADYFIIGSMYNIPRDVLEAYQSSTYENQEKATARHVSYTLQPKGDAFVQALETFFGYDKLGKRLYIDWNYLPFMQVFEAERADSQTKQITNFKAMMELGIPLDQINKFLDTDFDVPGYNPENQSL